MILIVAVEVEKKSGSHPLEPEILADLIGEELPDALWWDDTEYVIKSVKLANNAA